MLRVPTAALGTIALSLTAIPAFAVDGGSTGAHTRDRGQLDAIPRAALKTTATHIATTPPAHTVNSGDTVSAIAARYGLRTADVLAWNGLDWSSIIRPGDVIVLSAPAPAASPAPPSVAAVSEHAVVSGDTLWAIAQTHGVSLESLLAANALSASAIIYPGQRIAIPGAPVAAATVSPAVAPISLDAEQQQNARIIIDVGRGLGVSDRGIAIALATAMVESWIRNLDWGDRDSLGLFQQRPSMGWGSEAEVRDPYRAAAAFYGGPTDPNGTRTRGLLDLDDWQSMGFSEAAQAVQRSAYPDRYGPWEQQAYDWLAALG